VFCAVLLLDIFPLIKYILFVVDYSGNTSESNEHIQILQLISVIIEQTLIKNSNINLYLYDPIGRKIKNNQVRQNMRVGIDRRLICRTGNWKSWRMGCLGEMGCGGLGQIINQ